MEVVVEVNQPEPAVENGGEVHAQADQLLGVEGEPIPGEEEEGPGLGGEDDIPLDG